MDEKTNSLPPEQAASRWRATLSLARQVTQFLVMALVMGWVAGAAVKWDARFSSPPGFFRGMLHGALMPMAWPTLLAGVPQEIYAANNLGRLYNLGYSMGVNACGALFFGFTFWTFVQPRRPRNPTPDQRQKLQ